MVTIEEKRWRSVKAKIVLRFGTVTACARALKCSDQALRQTIRGKCPGVKKQLDHALRSVNGGHIERDLS